jgi:microcompartment protein CcmL/EutN
MKDSIGLIESKGLVALIEAADVILKNSPVKILGVKKLDNGLVTLALVGENEYLKAAMDAAINSGKRVGEIYAHSIIEKPDDLVIKLVDDLFAEEKDNSVPLIEVNEKVSEITPAESKGKIDKSEFDDKKLETKKNLRQKLPQKNKLDINVEVTKKTESVSELIEKSQPPESPVSDTISRLRKEALGISSVKKVEKEIKAEIKNENNSPESKTNTEVDFNYIEQLNVHKLRHYARDFENFPIKGRQISKANRDELIKLFKTLK